MKKKIKDRLRTGLVIILALVLLVIIFIWFRSSMDNDITTTTRDYLANNVNALSAVFHTKLEDQMVMLESQTRYFQDVDLTDYNKMKETILSTKGIGAFKSIGVATSAGSTMNYEGKSAGNILLQDYFQAAMQGESAMSAQTIKDEQEDEVLVLAVPIIQNEEPVGVVYGTFNKDGISDLLNVVRFDEHSANILLKEDGTILASTAGTNLISEDAANISEVIPGIQIQSGIEDQIFTYGPKNAQNILILTPVGVHDWYFGTILPESVLSDQVNKISTKVIVALFLIAVVVTLLLFYIVMSGRKNEKVQKELGDKASRDSLTGILNKMAFQQGSQYALDTNDGKNTFIMCIFDLDNFKHVNDTYGHAVGDLVIKETAARMRRVFTENDLLGRIGGDEFAVFITIPASDQTNPLKEICTRGEALLAEMRKPIKGDDCELTVGISAGFSYYPDHGTDHATLYVNADSALYKAKQGGKNHFEIHE